MQHWSNRQILSCYYMPHAMLAYMKGAKMNKNMPLATMRHYSGHFLHLWPHGPTVASSCLLY